MTIEEVHKDVEPHVQQVQLVHGEVESLKQQLASERKNVSEITMELQALKKQLEKSKTEAEQLRSPENRKHTRPKVCLELEDAKNTITELKEELAYKSNVNRSLGLQLEKTIESNSELLLEIKELDELLQKRETEIEELKAEMEERQADQKPEDEKAAWMRKLEDSEQERQELKKTISALQGTGISQTSNESTQRIRADNEALRKALEKAETELAEASKENMNLLSQLMALRHQTDEREDVVQQLISQHNDLQEKLHLSEELYQSQLESNKAFLEDLESKVEGLHTRNEHLELLLEASEERNAYLTEEFDALQKEIVKHEKERSLLGSQRGQLKILRDKISALTESYETAMKRGEDLDLVNKALREENQIAIASLNEQVKNLEHKLHESNAECIILKEKMKQAEIRSRDAHGQVTLLLGAKEAAETNTSSLRAEHAELQKQFASLVEAKERCDSSLSSLQETHAGLQERFKDAEHMSAEAINQLQERDIKVIELTEALNTAEGQLEKTGEQLSEVKAMTVTLQEKLELMQEERGSQKSHIEELELELARMKQSLDASNKSMSVSEDRIRNLQLRNDDLAEMLQSAMAFKEDVVSQLEAAIAKEAEMEQRIQKTEHALHCTKTEKASSDQALAELQERVRLLDDEKNVLQEKRRQHKIQQTQPVKASVRKDKNRASKEAIIKPKRSTSSLDEKDFQLLQDSSTKEVKKATDIDLKSEVMKLRNNAAELRRKLLEQEEEKVDVKKKLASIQKEAQRKSNLLTLTERKLKEKEKEQQRPLTRHLSTNASRKMGTTECNTPHGPKATVDLLERIKLLEGELNIKTVELEATKFVLKEKEAALCGGNPNTETEKCVDDHADMHSQGSSNKLECLQNKYASSGEHRILNDAGTREALHNEVRRLQMENEELKNSFLAPNEDSNTPKMESENAFKIDTDNNGPHKWSMMEREEAAQEEGTHLQEELMDMRERYSQMSLQFAELQIEKEELVATIRTLSRDTHK